MEEVSHMSQATADVQYLEELRQRINASAEKMLVFGKDSKHNWFFAIIGIALIAVFYVLVFHFGLFGDNALCISWSTFSLLIEDEVFARKEIPEEDNRRGDQFGNHVVQMHHIRSDIHDQFIQSQTDYPDDGKAHKFLPHAHFSAVLEYPTDTDQIIRHKA